MLNTHLHEYLYIYIYTYIWLLHILLKKRKKEKTHIYIYIYILSHHTARGPGAGMLVLPVSEMTTAKHPNSSIWKSIEISRN